MISTYHIEAMPAMDLRGWRSTHSFWHKLARAVWAITWFCLCRFTPPMFHGWRRIILRAAGAQVGRGARCYGSARIWAPWNLVLGDFSCIGPEVRCYNVGPITLGSNSVVSQFAHLCAASHDVHSPCFDLITKPIRIGDGCWVASDAFIGMGVSIGDGAVVGARACVFKDVEAGTIVGGNPARVLKSRQATRNAIDPVH